MPSLTDIARDQGALSPDEIDWLQLLVGDWQLLSDLSFADLMLWIRRGDGQFVAAALCRPSTAATAHLSDPIGRLPEPAVAEILERALVTPGVVTGGKPLVEAVAVRHEGRTIAVMVRHIGSRRLLASSGLEQEYLAAADRLSAMVGEGSYPQPGAPSGERRGAPRVGDGLVRLDESGVVTYASPNALSNFHRLGLVGELDGEVLATITADLVDGSEPVDEALPVVVMGRAPWRSQVHAHAVELSLRAVPLMSEGVRIGALVLCRDVTELQRRLRQLISKDATIREIHHRVKNNLQTVSALLRLQARRMQSAEAREALEEAIRRVATIALVHETLSHGFEEAVDFDDLLDRGLALTSTLLATPSSGASVRREGTFGLVHAQDANALALVLVELVSNAVEHNGGSSPEVAIAVQRDGGDLVVVVSDNGPGLPAGFAPGASGLGTQIVQTMVSGELGGRIEWRSGRAGGTEVTLSARLHDPGTH